MTAAALALCLAVLPQPRGERVPCPPLAGVHDCLGSRAVFVPLTDRQYYFFIEWPGTEVWRSGLATEVEPGILAVGVTTFPWECDQPGMFTWRYQVDPDGTEYLIGGLPLCCCDVKLTGRKADR